MSLGLQRHRLTPRAHRVRVISAPALALVAIGSTATGSNAISSTAIGSTGIDSTDSTAICSTGRHVGWRRMHGRAVVHGPVLLDIVLAFDTLG